MTKALSTHTNVAHITPAFLRSWSLESNVARPADLHAPDLLRILRCALTTKKALEKNKKKSNETACYTILGQIISRRSQDASDFSGPISLMCIGLSKGYDTTKKIINTTGNQCLLEAKEVAHSPDGHMLGYDNLNLSTSIFVEQRGSAGPAKVQSGTYPIIYKLRNPNPRALVLGPMLLRAHQAPDLNFNLDLCPTLEQSRRSHHQFCSYIIRVVCRYEPSFKHRQDEPALQSPPTRRLPDGYMTIDKAAKICTIEENSIKGNLAVHMEVDINQLGLKYEQLTAALGIGLFHLCLNLVWVVLNVHRGHVNHHSSLSHLFAVIEKTRLGGKHPDYHSLLAALKQVLDGLILNAWRTECGYHGLSEYAASKPSAVSLRAKAALILHTHGTPIRSPLHSSSLEASDTVPISDGDFGRVEDILPNLGMMFRGVGSKNYSTEILHFIHNMKKVWNANGFE
ncbi:hypothetical protein C8J57DRAFT_1435199 [Mycena rebaudengoi]|nr:hypothetical protein C8J57DRAFT_1435199 [Mycena rebaudengoi]